MLRRRGFLFFFALSLFCLYNLCIGDQQSSDEVNVPEMQAVRINPHTPEIDGDLNDPVWHSDKIHPVRGLRQMEPDEGAPASESTLVAVVYDDDAIYFAFWNYDSEPEKIRNNLVRRDRWVEADMVTVRLDPYHDHQTGYRFELNAAGVQRDFRLFSDTNNDIAWDGVWESATKIQPWGWSAEIRIPYHCLRFKSQDDYVWGCNVTRYISRKAESDWWAFSPSTEGGHVSRFGHLTGISGIRPARRLEIMPYAVSSFKSEPKSRGNLDGRDYLGNTGFDLKYGISSNMTLDATINPDFGQVELDEPVLNLSAYETFFEEKRPFFLEGTELYDTPFMLFYSRRIGRPPVQDVDDPNFDYYTDYPNSTTILGAAKVTGKVANGTSFGFLNAVTSREWAEYSSLVTEPVRGGDSTNQVDTVGVDTLRGVVETEASYSVLRLQKDVFSNSNVGLILTHVGQDSRYPAVTGGVDWRLYTSNGIWVLRGQSVFSKVDPEHTGFGINCVFEKDAGKHWQGSLGMTIKDPTLYINRLGYTSRNNSRRTYAWIQYRTSDDWFIFRNTYHNFNAWTGWNYEGDNIEKGGNYNTYLEFTNNWNLGGGINYEFAHAEDLETRGMGVWQRPSSLSWWASFNTDQGRMFSLNLNPGSGRSRYGSWWAHYTGLLFRPRSNMEYQLGVNYIRSFGQIIWVTNRDDQAIFADLDQDEISLALSAGITFRKNLSFQISGEGYLTGLDYQNYRPYLGSEKYGEPLDANEFDPTYDRNFSALNSTVILRWEYLPGSTLYLVWTRSRPETDRSINDLEFSRDFRRLFSAGSSNVWLAKISYWWNM